MQTEVIISDFAALNGELIIIQHYKAMLLAAKAEKAIRETMEKEKPVIEYIYCLSSEISSLRLSVTEKLRLLSNLYTPICL